MYDVIVSGAGPSGSIAAYQCASAGLSTAFLERDSIPREKCCAGGILQRVITSLPFELPSDVIEREIKGFVVQIGDHRTEFRFEERAGVVVKRARLDEFLTKKAVAVGAELFEEALATNVSESSSGVAVSTNKGRLDAKALIIAEGVSSRSARSLLGDYPTGNLAIGMASNLVLEQDPGDNIELNLIDTPTKGHRSRPDFPLNGWMFPHRDGANIGVVGKGANKERLRGSLDAIRRDVETRCGPTITEGGITSHPLPLVPRQVLHTKRAIAVGDAAGFVNPLTGEGISYSVLSGKIAAQTVSEMIANGFSQAAMRRYDEGCADLILKDLKAAAMISPILHRLMGVVDVRTFFSNFRDEKGLVEICLKIARGEDDWRSLLRSTIPSFPFLFFSSLRRS